MNKLKLIGLGNFGKITGFDFTREEIDSFFSIFPIFLENLNLEKTPFFFEENHPLESLGSDKHVVDKEYSNLDHCENDKFDLDIIFLSKIIKVVIRHKETDRNKIINEIKKIAEYSGFD